ncbi:MAG: tocopherol cyclase family protein [Bacteroidales bacterium]
MSQSAFFPGQRRIIMKLPGLYDLVKIWNPSWFQGNRRKRNFFEGWYIKLVSACDNHIWSFIPGVSFNHEDDHAFIQVINGKTGETWYFRFPTESFVFSKNDFHLKFGDNEVSRNHIRLNLRSPEGHFQGEISFTGQTPLNATLFRPGIMGWYRYVPFMECYHGVVSMNHSLQGQLNLNGHPADFHNGKGYIEKDWGTSMPQAWIWMQSNHFHTENTSFMLSLANIPWVGKSFPGFLGFFLHNNQQHLFATYNGAKITRLEIRDRELFLTIERKELRIDIRGEQGKTIPGKGEHAGALKAPHQGQMDRVIHENLSANLHLTVTHKSGTLLFEGTGRHAGLEMIGDVTSLRP